jgi:hypothetical protein
MKFLYVPRLCHRMLNFQQDYLHRYIFNESYYYNHKYLQVDIYWDELCTIN